MLQFTIAGERTKRANEQSIVFVHQNMAAMRRKVKTTDSFCRFCHQARLKWHFFFLQLPLHSKAAIFHNRP